MAVDAQGDYANRHLIGLEIARSMDTTSDRFNQAEANVALYIAHVCRQYGWTSARLHQHNWYSNTACPHRTKTHWQIFLTQVDQCIAELEGGTSGDDGASEGAGSTAGANSEGAESAAGMNADAPTITILCDGQPLTLRGHNENGTIYTSLRDLATALGHTVRWENGMAVVEK